MVAAGVAGCGGSGEQVPPPRPDNPGGAPMGDAYGTKQDLRIAEIAIGPDGVAPATLNAKAGAPASFTNGDDRTHRIVSTGKSNFKFRSRPIAPGEVYRLTLESPGRTTYRSTSGGKSYRGVIDVFGGGHPENTDDPTQNRERQGWSLTPDED